jgi:GT2 family glycosyltransferase
MKKAFDLHQVIGVGGRVLLKEPLQRPGWWHSEYDGALGKFDAGSTNILSDSSYSSIIGIGANLGFKRSVFRQYGDFHPHLDRHGTKLTMGGDIEYTDRLMAAGGLLMYYPPAVVFQRPDPDRFTKSYLRRWHFRIGEWEALKVRPGISRPSSIFRLPLWRYRGILQQLLQTVSSKLKRRHDEGFYQELGFISQLGYFFGAARNGMNWRAFSRKD